MERRSLMFAGFSLGEFLAATLLIGGIVIGAVTYVVTGSPASPMSWRCGLRSIPDGMEGAGENLTDIDRKFLPSACRGD